MRKIILASQSKARKALLRQVGIEFKVVPSKIKEGRALKKSCRGLTIANALKKAQDVAARCDSGIVIAADTVVLSGGKIIGKPRNLLDAFRTVKRLCRGPQWVYTGLAVVDVDNDKIYTDYEKTKIYMYTLSDRQIRRYFKRVSPLDKAGSFDIQGLGGLFIDRIEGCYFNVVGLPLAKLAKVLKKAQVHIF